MADYNVPVMTKISWQQPVKDKDLTAPPGGESKGNRYIVKATATGDWAGEATHIATAKQDNPSDPGHWLFATPVEGWIVWIEDEGKCYVFNGTAWISSFDFCQLEIQGNDITNSILHGGKKEHLAGNNGVGQSNPAYVKYAPSAAIAGSINTAQDTFTRAAGTWVVDILIGQYGYFYDSADYDGGTWLEITDNTTTTITVTGTIPAVADRVKTCIWKPTQNEYSHGKGPNTAFYGGVFDGESIWLVPYNSDDIIKVNPSDGSMISYPHGKGNTAFSGGTFDGESIWLVPCRSDELVKLDPSDGSMISYPHGKGDYAFVGGVFDGEKIWLVPRNSDDIISFIPPRFGRPSIHTGGPVNAASGRIGDGTNRTEIKTDGEINLHGAARVTNALWIGANAVKDPPTQPAVFVDHGISGAWQFTDGAQDSIVANIKVPNRMDRSVAPTISIGWSSTATGLVGKWQLEYLWRKVGEDTTAAAQATLTVTGTTPAQAEGMVISTFAALAVPDSDDVCLHLRIRRLGDDAADTLSADAELHGLCLNFTSNKLGAAT